MNNFTEEEVKAAKSTRQVIIEENVPELKSIYIAGEICMWDELKSQLQTKDKEIEELRQAFDGCKKHKDMIVSSKNKQLQEYKEEVERLKELKDEIQYLIKFSHHNGDIINGSMTRESVLNIKSQLYTKVKTEGK